MLKAGLPGRLDWGKTCLMSPAHSSSGRVVLCGLPMSMVTGQTLKLLGYESLAACVCVCVCVCVWFIFAPQVTQPPRPCDPELSLQPGIPPFLLTVFSISQSRCTNASCGPKQYSHYLWGRLTLQVWSNKPDLWGQWAGQRLIPQRKGPSSRFLWRTVSSAGRIVNTLRVFRCLSCNTAKVCVGVTSDPCSLMHAAPSLYTHTAGRTAPLCGGGQRCEPLNPSNIRFGAVAMEKWNQTAVIFV